MKKLFTLPFIGAGLLIQAQNYQTVSLSYGPGYSQDIYYSCATGQVAAVPANNWDIAFTSRLMDASILINEVKGVQLYEVSSDVNDFTNLDTTGLLTTPLHNSDTAWEYGAFNANATVHPNYGWGNYNQITHTVTGTKVFVLVLADGTYKKMVIDAMDASGTYTFRIANLDNTGLLTKTASKATYSTKNFFYYDVAGDLFVDREPATTTWDLVFRRYLSPIQNQWYPVSGVQSNLGIQTAEARGVDTTQVVWGNYPLSSDNINVIGSDWKYFDMNAFQFMVEDSLSYFVESQDGNLYKLVFKSFSGTSTGNFSFSQSIASSIGAEESKVINFSFFPNPASSWVRITGIENGKTVELIAINGQVVDRQVATHGEATFGVSNLPRGMYLLRVEGAVNKLMLN